MERLEALDLLSSESAVDRLRAARALGHVATSADRPTLEAALTRESDAWVKSALTRIVGTALSERATEVSTEDAVVEDPAQLARDVRAQTTQELTAMVTHELQPLLGTLREAGSREVTEYGGSDIQRAIAGLESFVGALKSLHLASGVPSVTDFSLSDLVHEVSKDALAERDRRGATAVPVSAARSDHVAASGDRDLVRLAFLNIIRNALEASDPTAGGSGEPVLVNWGSTDRDAWIAVFDRGIGLPPGASRMGEPGVTTKERGLHRGMGLAVSQRALDNMNGTLTHKPREGGGVVAEMRWGGDKGADTSTSD